MNPACRIPWMWELVMLLTPEFDGGIWKGEGKKPPLGSAINAFNCSIEVMDIDETMGKVKAELNRGRFAGKYRVWAMKRICYLLILEEH